MSSSNARDQDSADLSPSPTGPRASSAPETPAAMLHHGSKHPASTSTSKSLTSHEPKSSVSGKKIDKRYVKKPEKDKKKQSNVKDGNSGPPASVSSSKKEQSSHSRDENKNLADVDSRLTKLESMLNRVIGALPLPEEDYDQHYAEHAHNEDSADDHDDINPYQSCQRLYTQPVDVDYDDITCTSQEESTLPKMIPTFAAKFAAQSDEGPPLEEEMASSTMFMMNNKLEEKVLEETGIKYLPPSNCPYLDVPKVNPVIWENLSPSTRSRDLKLARVQKSLTRGLTAFTRSISSGNLSPSQQDALALLSNANYEMNALRKEQIKPDMNAAYSHLCKPTIPVTKFLFGDDLGKRVKDMTEEQKATGRVVKTSEPGRGRYRAHANYHPYRAGDYSRQGYRAAGWSTPNHRPQSGAPYRPFLDRKAPIRGRRQPQAPMVKKPPASQGRYRENPQRK
ncbi:uncharacterized protein LOC121426135 [Lytechinus variegatus]|uniref:uncharacterized protein LOC121426135 n=1 Tax=Lytechinus variegatus TaxID=7654 RepID=UPI001BB1513C|nr:uncharacterized protein LOC121426135 [Lytechinus variegatus]